MSAKHRLPFLGLLIMVFSWVGVPPSGASGAATLVVCAPGYPGSTVEAQPAMDDFAAAVAAAAGWGDGAFRSVYFETEEGGLARLAEPDADLAMVTLPFFLEHQSRLNLRPIALAVPEGREQLEPWALVAGIGKVRQPSDLDGWNIVSLAGHSPRFVRGPVLGDWGELPAGTGVSHSRAVLSSLRKAAKGEPVAVLLDAEQTEALDRLPFADDLEVVHRSRPLPVSVVCAVGNRLEEVGIDAVEQALLGLDQYSSAADALAGVRLDRFEPPDVAALELAEAMFAKAAR
ncbi:MAG: hypothetical protein V2I67_12655 [Thermoanaerobaculales bacterium]|jgi:hypothetical protein|nr:hypothetical protein [Thermoanaerobaculales bacterium]